MVQYILIRLQFMEVVDVLAKGSSAQEELFKLFNEQGYSDYVVVYLRLITSSELQRDAEFYSNFIEGDRTIPEFCHQVCSVVIVIQALKMVSNDEFIFMKRWYVLGSGTYV